MREKLSNKQVWAFFALACFLTGLAWSWLSFLLERQSVTIAFRAMLWPKYWLTALLFFALTALFALLTRNLLAGGLIGGLPLLMLGVVNYYKLSITGTPLTLNDLALTGRLGDIVTLNAQSLAPGRHVVLAVLGILLWSLALWFFSKPLAPAAWKESLLSALVPFAVLVGVFWLAVDPLVLTPVHRPLAMGRLSQSLVNQATGFPLGMLRTLKLYSLLPNQVSDAEMERILSELEEELGPAEAAGTVRPNVVLILSESFFDVTTLPGVTYAADPIPEFHALQKEGVSGRFYSRTLGYGTCNIELEMLTGINTILTYSEDICNLSPETLALVPAVPQLLKSAGYDTVMLHMYDDSIYSRDSRMEAIGFDRRYFMGDFAAIDPDAAHAPDYWGYLAQYVSGAYYSDAYMADLVTLLYDQKPAGRPLFTYAISMENHTPYESAGKYGPGGCTVSCTAPLSDEALDILTNASQGCSNASRALGRLVDYFRQSDEPTVILFFGDHRPGLTLAGGAGVYEQLYSAAGMWSANGSEEQIARLCTTDYLIWANDPDLLPAAPGTRQDTSSNYFGLSILDAAQVKKPLYWRMLAQLSQNRIIDTPEYSMGRDYVAHMTPPTEGEDAQRIRRASSVMLKALYGGNPCAVRLRS